MLLTIVRRALGTAHVSFVRIMPMLALVTAACAGGDGAPTGAGEPPVRPGTLGVTVSGLPAGAAATIDVAGPDSYHRTLAGTESLGGLVPGQYQLNATDVTTGADRYGATPAVQTVVIAPGGSASVTVGYGPLTGTLEVVIAGLPAGATPNVTVSGPGGFARTVTATGALTGLNPGLYAITATAVVADGHTWTPASAQIAVSVSPGPAPVPATVNYQLATGAIVAGITGLPDGSPATATLHGPNQFERVVAAGETVTNLVPGAYTLTADAVTVGVDAYRVPTPATVNVVPSLTPVSVGIAYTLASGRLAVSVNGLPAQTSPSIDVSGPGGFHQTLTAAQALGGLVPGSYAITATAVSTPAAVYAAAPAGQQVTVSASSIATPVSVTYAVSSGSIALVVNGLPASAPGRVTVTGPDGFNATLATTGTLTRLTPGTYTVTAASTTADAHQYAPGPASQTVVVSASLVAAPAIVTYTLVAGALDLAITGLPPGTDAAAVVSGPGGYTQPASASRHLTGLAPGTYAISAATVTSGSDSYAPSPASQNATVVAGLTASTALTYTLVATQPPPTLNLSIDAVQVQQVVQNYAGTVPLVAGRDGLLRVFVKASQANSAAPAVRVRFYDGSNALLNTVTITAPVAVVPTTMTEGILGSSWNYPIPAAMMQPGLRILADVDPGNSVSETSESDNTWPASGSARAMDVRTVPAFNLRFVPVTQSANGLTGGVTPGNASSYSASARQVYPLGTVAADVRAPFTTNAPVLESADGNGAWEQILSEISALRAADGSTSYYYGVVRVNYFSGVAGLGYVPGRAAIGWDYLPSAAEVAAHEIGHNFGRFHAPCGGAGSPDPAFPYAGGAIGSYGYDATSGLLKPPTTADLKGYCSNVWISDYNYTAVLNYRAANPFLGSLPSADIAPRPGLLIWGRIHHGQAILEPAFDVVAPPSLPPRAGRSRIQVLDASGASLVDLSFDGEHPADASDPTDEHFAFVVPKERFGVRQPARLLLSAAGRQLDLTALAATAGPPSPTVERLTSNTVRVRWNASQARGILIRDVRTHEILSFGRGGEATVVTREGDVDLTVSDGVRSTVQRVRVSPGAGPARR